MPSRLLDDGGTMAEPESEELLLSRCLKRDEDAWRTLVDRYASYIYTIITRGFSFAGEDARDVFQQSVIRVFETLPNYRGSGEFRAWLRQVVRTCCLADLRRHKSTEPLNENMVDQTQEDVLDRIERAYVLTQALQRIEPDCRQILELFFLRAQPYRAIAAKLGIPQGTVGSRLARCLTKLRARVRDLR